MLGRAQASSQITKHSVDPLKLWQALRLAAADDGGLARAVNQIECVEAGRTLGVHSAAGRRVLGRPVPQGSEREARNRSQLHTQRVFVPGQRHRGQERDLVFRPEPGFAAAAPPPDRHHRSAPCRATL